MAVDGGLILGNCTPSLLALLDTGGMPAYVIVVRACRPRVSLSSASGASLTTARRCVCAYAAVHRSRFPCLARRLSRSESPCLLCSHAPSLLPVLAPRIAGLRFVQVVPDAALTRFVPEKLVNSMHYLLRKQFCSALQLSQCPREGCSFVLEHQGAEVRVLQPGSIVVIGCPCVPVRRPCSCTPIGTFGVRGIMIRLA